MAISTIEYTVFGSPDESRNGLNEIIELRLNEFSISMEPTSETAVTNDGSTMQRTTVKLVEKVTFTLKGVSPLVVQKWDEFVRSQYLTSDYFVLDATALSPYYRELTCYLVNTRWEPRYRGRDQYDITREARIVE